MSDNKKLIVFDFDGTIANSLPVIYEAGGEVIESYTGKRIAPREIERLKENGIKSSLKKLDVPFYKFPIMLLKIQVEIYKRIDEVNLFPKIEKTAYDLNKKYKLGIFTNNRKKTVDKFLKKNKLDIFEFVKDNPFLRDKSKKLSRMPDNALAYVGDQAEDIEAAKKANLLAVGVSWGLDSKGRLKRSGADFIAEEPEELVEFFRKNNN